MFPFIIGQKDSKLAGCYNLQCAGFVPTSGGSLWPGQAVTPPSSYGEYDHYARLSLNKVHAFSSIDTNIPIHACI